MTSARKYSVSLRSVRGNLCVMLQNLKTGQRFQPRRARIYPNAAAVRLDCPADMTVADRAELLGVFNRTPRPLWNDDSRRS